MMSMMNNNKKKKKRPLDAEILAPEQEEQVVGGVEIDTAVNIEYDPNLSTYNATFLNPSHDNGDIYNSYDSEDICNSNTIPKATTYINL